MELTERRFVSWCLVGQWMECIWRNDIARIQIYLPIAMKEITNIFDFDGKRSFSIQLWINAIRFYGACMTLLELVFSVIRIVIAFHLVVFDVAPQSTVFSPSSFLLRRLDGVCIWFYEKMNISKCWMIARRSSFGWDTIFNRINWSVQCVADNNIRNSLAHSDSKQKATAQGRNDSNAETF